MHPSSSSNRILVVAAHPDDEVLGCGGVIARHVDEGDSVSVLIVSEGATSRSSCRDRTIYSSDLSDLARAANKAASILGVSNLDLLDYPDNRLDSIDRLDLTKCIESHINDLNPSIVYVHHAGDVNIDHRRLHESVITACRPTPGYPVRRVLSFEVQSSTEWQIPGSAPIFCPNWFVDITDQWERKREALIAYSSEMRSWPHSRSIKSVEYLARCRGSSVGVDFAEAFMLLRQIV